LHRAPQWQGAEEGRVGSRNCRNRSRCRGSASGRSNHPRHTRHEESL